MIVVKVRDRDIKAAPMGPVTTGSVGLPVSWHFIGKEWEDLAKAAVFRVGNDGTEITVAVLEDLCLVPDELLVQANAGENLWIGVYGWRGTNANDTIVPEIAMPTIWTYTRIQDGSQPSGIEPPEGTPGWSAQIQNATDEALRVAHGVAADAAEGDFDGISPAVTISSITHGHSVNITDRDHPTGQSFPVLDGDSAYEQAVAGGYTGTEAQFNEELANFKELSDETKEAAPFYAEYGVTTKAEIQAAINGKRQIYLHHGNLGGIVAPYTGTFLYADIWGEGTGYGFALTNGNFQYVYELKSEWTYSIYDLTAPAQRAETAAAQALTRMNSADASAQAAAGSAGNASTAATTATTKAGEASDSATAADGSAKDSEAYAIGKRGGTDVGSTDPAYHNNAKYYAQQASGSATAASGSATSAASSATAAGNAQTAAETAQSAAEDAQEAAEAVLASIPEDYTELSGDVDELKSAIDKNNSANILDNVTVSTSTTVGITFSVIDKQTIHVEGTSTSLAIKNIYSSQTIPGWLEKGKQYYLEYSTESKKVLFRIYIYRNGTLVSSALVEAVGNQVFTIPTDATGVIFRLAVKNGNTVNEDVTFAVLTAESNSQLSRNIENLSDDAIKNNVPSASVASGDDLNNSKYLTPGQWKISTTAIAVSLVNRPVYLNSTGTLTVVNTHNTNHVYQLIMSNQGTEAWTRHVRIDTGVFDDWCSVISSSGYSWKSNNFLIHTPSEESRYMIDALKAINVNITSSMDWPKTTDGERNLSSDVAYALWDALQAKYPEYIDTGETIAYSLDTNGNNYKPVKAYYIHPKLTYGVSGQIQYPDMPTIYITAGTHGSEPTPVWNLYAIFARAFESNSIYADFLTGKKYRVVPCFSRWSYDHAKRYLAAAYNADGTTKESAIDPNTGEISELYDANRQCICSNNDSPSYDTLMLNSFATEARGLIDYMQAHGYSPDNNDCYIDLHNNSESLGYFGSWRQDLRNDYDVMMDRLAKIWKQHATWANGDPVDYYNSSISDHTALNGKICGRTIEQLTFAWFFYYAANQSKSMLLEVQPYDSGGSANSYALAKGLDMTYRWFKALLE